MSDRPTPMTDAAAGYVDENGDLRDDDRHHRWLVLADFARDLERKLAKANEQIAAMAKHEAAALESDSVVASCNCGKKSPDIQHHARGCKYRLIVERDESRTKLAEAREALEDIKGRCSDMSITLHPDADAKGCVDDCWEWSEKAIARIDAKGKETA